MKDTLIDRRYLLLDEIGSGGEARVFRARDTVTGEEVAARLALRGKATAAPAQPPPFHPGWCRLHATGDDPQHGAYQILELLTGPTLRQLIKSGPVGPEPWLSFANQSLDAVAALHDTGWIHGDLNADNFIQASPSSPRWKLLELPFLRFEPPANRSPLFGSIHTLAPEQIDGAPADARSDLYALGCLYYFAASGNFPHADASNRQIAINRLCFAAEPLAEKAPDFPPAWAGWVMTLLARKPGDRRPSVAAAHHLLKIA